MPQALPSTAGRAATGGAARSLVVVSPHLDDAVFGCGALLAAHPGSVVVTVFAGCPAPPQTTDWDRRCGFADSSAAIAARRQEDEAALSRLGARAVWLDFLDAQYGEAPAASAVAAALQPWRPPEDAPLPLFPLGLFHADHRLVHEAGRALMAPPLWVYEDAIYRAMPGLLQQRLAALDASGLRATPVQFMNGATQASQHAKREAAAAYASQLRALGTQGRADLEAPERLWRLDAATASEAPER